MSCLRFFTKGMVWIVVGLTLGCSHTYHLSPEEMNKPSVWKFARQSVAGDAAVSGETTYSGALDILWEHGVGGKPAGPLTIYHETLIYPSTKKKIRFYDIATGKYKGRLKSKGPVYSGVVIADSLAFFAISPPKRRLYCFNLLTGKKVWKRRIKDTPGGPIIVENRLLMSSTAGVITAYDLFTGKVAWSYKTDERFISPAVYGAGLIYQPGDKGKIYALNPQNGSEEFCVQLDGPVSGVAVGEHRLIAATVTGHIYGMNPRDGLVLWNVSFESPIWAAPAVTSQYTVIGLNSGEIVALNTRDGIEKWRFETVEVVRTSPIVVGSKVITGTVGGTVFSLDIGDGRLVDKRKLNAAITVNPVSDGNRVLVATAKGAIICFGEHDEQQSQADKRIDSQYQSQ